MDLEKIKVGYENEVNYQKKMLQNLQSWLQTLLAVAAIGFVLCYYFYGRNTGLLIIGVVLLVIGVLGAAIVAYGRHRGKQNVKLVISDYENKINSLKNK